MLIILCNFSIEGTIVVVEEMLCPEDDIATQAIACGQRVTVSFNNGSSPL